MLDSLEKDLLVDITLKASDADTYEYCIQQQLPWIREEATKKEDIDYDEYYDIIMAKAKEQGLL